MEHYDANDDGERYYGRDRGYNIGSSGRGRGGTIVNTGGGRRDNYGSRGEGRVGNIETRRDGYMNNRSEHREEVPSIRTEIRDLKRRLVQVEEEVLKLAKTNHNLTERLASIEVQADPELKNLLDEELKLQQELEKKREAIEAKKCKKS